MIGERIKDIRSGKKLSQKAFAELLSTSSGYISEIEHGKALPGASFLISLKRAFNISLDWVMTGEGPMEMGQAAEEKEAGISQGGPEPARKLAEIPDVDAPDPDSFNYVPMAENRLGAGGGAFVISEAMRELYAFRRDWLRRIASSAKNIILMQIVGDSMEPTILDGDTVMLDRGRIQLLNGCIYAIGVGEAILIKRLELMATGRVRIISNNREYPPYEADQADVRILGQIIWYARALVKPEG